MSLDKFARDLFRYLLVNGYLFSRSSASAEPVRLRDSAEPPPVVVESVLKRELYGRVDVGVEVVDVADVVLDALARPLGV